MSLIASIDPINRLIYLSIDTMNTAWHPYDLYLEVRALRKLDESLRSYDNFMEGAGNIDKGGGKATERYFTLLDGVRIVPYNQTHIIDITGTIITDDGFEGAFCFDKTSLSAGVSVDIQYSPKQVEVIVIDLSGIAADVAESLELNKANRYHNHVHVDVNNGVTGTVYPTGTLENPVSNITDAVIIANSLGLSELIIAEDVVVTATDDVSGFTLTGAHALKSEITVQVGALTNFTQFKNCNLIGTVNGDCIVRESTVGDLNNFTGILYSCAFSGTLALNGSKIVYLFECFSAVPGLQTPSIDMGGSGVALAIRAYSGGIKIENRTGTDNVSIDMDSGHIIIDGTVTAGEIIVRGVAILTDNSNGTAVVNSDGLLNLTSIGEAAGGSPNEELVTVVNKALNELKTVDVVVDLIEEESIQIVSDPRDTPDTIEIAVEEEAEIVISVEQENEVTVAIVENDTIENIGE